MRTKSIKFLRPGILFFFLIVMYSCEKENLMVDNKTEVSTCSDAIMNGDEIGIDCGGSCNPCEDGMVIERRTELYVTSTANGNIGKLTTGDNWITISTPSMASEGIYYSKAEDVLVQASRSSLQLDAFLETGQQNMDTSLTPSFSSTVDLESPRELAVNGSTYVVSDNGSNKFFVYKKSGESFSLINTVQIPFAVWGITFKGKDLYAVVDKSGDLAVFYNFEANAIDGVLMPSKKVTIEGIVRTHGITYSGSKDVMVLTDIGDAANTTDDGGFQIISDFSSKFDALSDGAVLPLSMQVRVAGSSTSMGNPIDVAYDSETNVVYIAEIGNEKVLGFSNFQNGGDIAPSFVKALPAPSSLYFSSDETDGDIGTETLTMRTELYATTTASGAIKVYDGNGYLVKTVNTESASSEGIYYEAMNDAVIQASRSNLNLGYYSNFSGIMDGADIAADFSSTSDLVSPREIAVKGNRVVVSDNGENKFYVYCYSGTSFILVNTFTVNCNLWGITFKGDDLLAVADKSGNLSIFTNFLTANTADGVIAADKTITIEGIVRTHGIDYSAADDVLVMTDIGDAANTSDDGAFQIIQGFSAKLDALGNGGTLALADQTRVSGAATLMGNPIDVAYDHNSKTVFIAETGNGKILGFKDALGASGDVAPTITNDLMGASSIYLYNN